MIKSPLLRAPDQAGIFDHVDLSAGISFLMEKLHPDVFKPDLTNWKWNYQLFHEWAHFYQFTTTSYGFLYNVFTYCQFLMVNGFLRTYGGEVPGYPRGADAKKKFRCRLPLLEEGENSSLETEDLWRGNLRVVYNLEQYRNSIFGYSDFPVPITDFLKSEEFATISGLGTTLGMPTIFVGHTPEKFYSSTHRYKIDDLLESHAHALASLWLYDAVDKYKLPKKISADIREYSASMAIGPYGNLLKYGEILPTDNRMKLYVFCALCDIALNPFCFYSDKQKAITVTGHSWSPVERFWHLINLAGEKRIRMPDFKKYPYPDFQHKFIEHLISDCMKEIRVLYTIPPDLTIDHILAPLIEKADHFMKTGDVPESLCLRWLDIIGSYKVAFENRKVVPLLLAGGNIDELKLLMRSVGGPSLFHKSNGSSRVYHRVCNGLVHLGYLNQKNMIPESDKIFVESFSIIEAFKALMYMNLKEVKKIAGKRRYTNSISLSEVLANWYTVTVDDFR